MEDPIQNMTEKDRNFKNLHSFNFLLILDTRVQCGKLTDFNLKVCMIHSNFLCKNEKKLLYK